MYAGLETYDQIMAFFLRLYELGIYNLHGNDSSSDTYWGAMCKANFEDSAFCLIPDDPLPRWDLLKFNSVSYGSFMYFAQLYLEQRFQEPQSIEKYAAGDRITPLVPLSNIDRVPISLVSGSADARCPLPFISQT